MYKTINDRMLNDILDKYDTNIIIEWNDTKTMMKLIQLLYIKKYSFVGGYYCNLTKSTEEIQEEIYKMFYQYYHKNSKIYLHIFYNNITGKNDIQFTNLVSFRSYPQLKNKPIYHYFGN